MDFQALAFTINEWCTARRFSRGMFYNLQKAGKGPRVHKVGDRTLISIEADREWLKQREAEAEAEIAAKAPKNAAKASAIAAAKASKARGAS
ncbi:transcriptional regulator [Nordella sp. HKS 07]|uniref:transcriptional regulator n=1 Tax=Nordella sp. HKS 07 TaxID=2712222 RepID=UPI0013E1197B|nr:transcriptional regulator [Nordella sp. HKS 07]QIG46781.1 transcriptional regulator [Nordella sp. HKS 07]